MKRFEDCNKIRLVWILMVSLGSVLPSAVAEKFLEREFDINDLKSWDLLY